MGISILREPPHVMKSREERDNDTDICHRVRGYFNPFLQHFPLKGSYTVSLEL